MEIRECTTAEELAGCVELQRSVFALPEMEISPVRHFIVTMHAGGFALGAFDKGALVGFVLSVPAFLNGEKAFYSHMTAVSKEYQSHGIGAKLKFAQRERSLEAGVRYVKWTFQPVLARNAYFNLEKLGAKVKKYLPDFYGADYTTAPDLPGDMGLESDRLLAEWDLLDSRAVALAEGRKFVESRTPVRKIETTNEWERLVREDPYGASAFQKRLREEFTNAFSEGLVCEGFERHPDVPGFLLYHPLG